jgi:hypothetical protein
MAGCSVGVGILWQAVSARKRKTAIGMARNRRKMYL